MTNFITTLAKNAKHAAQILAGAKTKSINNALSDLITLLEKHRDDILAANKIDLLAAEKAEKPPAFIDRLTLTAARLEGMINAVRIIIDLPDPVGDVIMEKERPNGLLIRKVRVPFGVIGMIYESRPNVTIDASCLCLKSHNAVILRGGSEALNTNKFLHGLFVIALKQNNLPEDAVCFVDSSDREHVTEMLKARGLIDIIIPRGGKGLTDKVMQDSKVPVFAHLDGICHVYVDESAKPDIARSVVINSKMRRTGICGAAETLLLDMALPAPQKKDIVNQLIKAGCVVKGEADLQALDKRVEMATEADWDTEYLDSIISVKIVDGVHGAIEHINTHGSHHTDSIIAEDPESVDVFLQDVDSAIVMHNTSTQFADGGEFGMGAEIGIATGKLHARGPVALEQLTTYKYHVLGTGQIRE